MSRNLTGLMLSVLCLSSAAWSGAAWGDDWQHTSQLKGSDGTVIQIDYQCPLRPGTSEYVEPVYVNVYLKSNCTGPVQVKLLSTQFGSTYSAQDVELQADPNDRCHFYADAGSIPYASHGGVLHQQLQLTVQNRLVYDSVSGAETFNYTLNWKYKAPTDNGQE